MLKQSLTVASKDITSELRTRYGISAIALFVLTAVVLVAFSVAGEPLSPPMVSAMVWIVMVFASMTGLGRAFISEEERGTWIFLRIHTKPLAVYFGKLMVNVVLSVITNTLGVGLMLLFIPTAAVGTPMMLLLVVAVGSIGLAAVLTIVSAIVARSGTRSPVLPVLSFPILVPILMIGIRVTLLSLAGFQFSEAASDVTLMLVYAGIVIVLSTFVFETVWRE